MNLGTRIKLERERQGLTQGQLARKAGLPEKDGQQTIAALESRDSIKSQWAPALADALGVSLTWALTGEHSFSYPDESSADEPMAPRNPEGVDELSTNYRVEQLDIAGGMGDGVINADYPDVIRVVEFDPTYIRALIGFLPAPGTLKLVTGRGDSMVPTIAPGDVALLYTGCQQFDGDGIYFVDSGRGAQIKLLQDRADGIYVVSSNRAYAEYKAGESLRIIGRIYAHARIIRMV